MTDILALACLLFALPGLLLERFGPLGVRILTLLALLALGIAALDFERVVEIEEPARVALVGTRGPPPAELGRRIAAAGAEVEVVAAATSARAAGSFRERLALGAVRAGPRARELLLLWSGPLEVEEPVLAGHGLTAIVPDQVLDLDPARLQTWMVGGMQADRPAGLQVRLHDAHRVLRAEIAVTDPTGSEVLHEEVELGPEAPVVELPLIPEVPGSHALSLRARVDGIGIERRGSFDVAAAPPVMVVGRGAGQLALALRVQGMEVVESPSLPADLSAFSAVVLLQPTTPAEQESLGTWLEAGGGLLVVGGEGGALPDRDQPLHQILPVLCLPQDPSAAEAGDATGAEGGTSRPQEADEAQPGRPPTPPAGEVGETRLDPTAEEVERRLVGMVLVVDRSQSMGERVLGDTGNTKMDYAKASAIATAEALQAGDELGLVTFGNQGRGRTELALTPVSDEAQIRERIRRLAHAREGTYLASGLERAGDLLERSRAAVKFIVVITDGIFQDDDLYVTSTARRLGEHGINVSLIHIIGGPNEGGAFKSKKVSDAGQGTYMRTQSAREVPRLVVAEVGRALERVGRKPARLPEPGSGEPGEGPPDPSSSGQPPQAEPPTAEGPDAEAETRLEVRAVTDSVLLDPRRPAGFPDLGGMDPVRGRPDAHVLLVAGREGLPLLAFANRGLGRIAVWASDLTGPWGQAWREDPDFPGRLATWVQSLFPPRPAAPGDVLTATSVDPVVPTARDLAVLARLATGPVLGASEFEVPGPTTRPSARGMGQELSLAAIISLLILALGECLLLRWKARWS